MSLKRLMVENIEGSYKDVNKRLMTPHRKDPELNKYLNDIKSGNYKPNSKEALIEWGDGTKVRVSIDKVEGEVVYGSVDPEYLKKLHTLNNEEIYFNIDKISLIR